MKSNPLLMVLPALALVGCNRSSDLASLPGIQGGKYEVAPYLRAADRLQGLGREAACKELLKAKANDQVIVLCRMLFVKRSATEFRRPYIGAAIFLGGTDYPDWPLEPIELVDGVPFLITQGYMLGGEPEPADSYLRWCMANCDWNPTAFGEPTLDETRAALGRLMDSSKWKRPLGRYEQEFLSAQTR